MLTAAHGSSVRNIGTIDQRGWIGLLGKGLLTFTRPGHIDFLRRNDATLVASSSWRGSGRDVDAVDVSDDGRLFAFRVSNGQRPGIAAVYVLLAGEHAAHIVYRHRVVRRACGYAAGVDWQGSSLLYRSDDGTGVAEVAVVALDGSSTRLTPLLAALPRVSRATPGNALWATAFLP